MADLRRPALLLAGLALAGVASAQAVPQTISCSGSCTVTLVLPDLFNMSPDNGAQISVAVALVWATGWAIRMLIRLLSNGRSGVTDEE